MAIKWIQRDSVRIVAVTKAVTLDRIQEAYQAGYRIFGENYVQEALPKIEALHSLSPPAEWHFLGSLQSNKAKQVVGRFTLIHSLDRWSLAQALDREATKVETEVKVLLEVNIAGEKTKAGLKPDEVADFARKVSSQTSLSILGLMSFPPFTGDPETSRNYFRQTRKLAEKLADFGLPRVEMRELSMGVSSDYEIAIEEGATIIRLGTAIFGPRA